MNKLRQTKKERNKKDKEWKEACLKAYGKVCSCCGSTKLINLHHIVPRELASLRWDKMNCIPLCPKHHKFGLFSAHKNGLWFIEWLSHNRFGQYIYLIEKLNELEKEK